MEVHTQMFIITMDIYLIFSIVKGTAFIHQTLHHHKSIRKNIRYCSFMLSISASNVLQEEELIKNIHLPMVQ